jgi:hypothetical protein
LSIGRGRRPHPLTDRGSALSLSLSLSLSFSLSLSLSLCLVRGNGRTLDRQSAEAHRAPRPARVERSAPRAARRRRCRMGVPSIARSSARPMAPRPTFRVARPHARVQETGTCSPRSRGRGSGPRASAGKTFPVNGVGSHETRKVERAEVVRLVRPERNLAKGIARVIDRATTAGWSGDAVARGSATRCWGAGS